MESGEQTRGQRRVQSRKGEENEVEEVGGRRKERQGMEGGRRRWKEKAQEAVRKSIGRERHTQRTITYLDTLWPRDVCRCR